MSRRGTVKDRLEYAGLAAVLRSLGALPVPRARAAGSALGSLMARVAPLRRDRALKNLALAFPQLTPQERGEVYLAMMRNLGRVLGDFAHLPRYSGEDVLRHCPVEGRGHFDRLRESGRGGVLLTGHYGNWELLGASAACSVPVVYLGARQRNPYVEALFNARRVRLGARAVSLGDGLRPLVRHLKEGRVLATLADQDGGRNGWFIDFLGTPASVRPGVFRLMARLNAPMITGCSWWTGSGWQARIEAPVDPGDMPGNEEERALALATLYTRRLEASVRERPDHWFWVHHRWRSRPAP